MLPVLGRHIAAWVVSEWDVPTLKTEFDKMHQWAVNRFMLQPEDNARLEAGEISQEDYNRKLNSRPRPIYNSTVTLFGIVQLRRILQSLMPVAEFDLKFSALFKEMAKSVYDNMDTIAKTIMPEYIKVLQTISDITKLQEPSSVYSLTENFDYNLTSHADKSVLVIHVRTVYNKYRAYMRAIGSEPLYPTDSSFEIALTETAQFLGYGDGTFSRKGRTIILDMDELARSGVPLWEGKSRSLLS